MTRIKCGKFFCIYNFVRQRQRFTVSLSQMLLSGNPDRRPLYQLSPSRSPVCRNIGKKGRPEEPEELAFSAPAQRANGQPRADNRDPRANLAGTESQMSTVSETHANNDESASAPRRRTGHEEITDLAYEAADHTQDFAEEIEDAVSALPFRFLY